MGTPHIGANRGDVAETILLPGDPLRAKYIAETFLEDVVQYNNVRGMLGFTGTYKGKKVSESEGVGTTGKVFKSQKEALDFGKKEIKRLTEEDKKGRQFSISKVAAEDGSLIGWTVDIFEDNNIEKIVSNPVKETEDK